MVYFFSVAPSSAPGNVQVSISSSTSLKVTWQAPTAVDKNGTVTGYVIHYQAAGGAFTDNTWKRMQVPASSSEAKLTGLKAYVEYNISVSASTAGGDGSASVSVIARTSEAGKESLLTHFLEIRNSC